MGVLFPKLSKIIQNFRDLLFQQKYARFAHYKNIKKSNGYIWCYGFRHHVSLYLLSHLSKLRFVIIYTDTIPACCSYYTPNSF